MKNWINLQNILKERGSKSKLSEKTGISIIKTDSFYAQGKVIGKFHSD